MPTGHRSDTLRRDYLDRLRTATADLPAGPRAELLDNIDAHLTESTEDADESRVRQVLDELGTPEEIAATARAEHGVTGPEADRGERAYDVLTVLALLLGGFVVPVVGWIAGVVMIWSGPRWSTGDKWLGTLAWPAVLVLGVLLVVVVDGGRSGILALLAAGVLGLVGLVLVFAHLLRAATRRRATPPSAPDGR